MQFTTFNWRYNMLYEIKHRFTNNIICSFELEDTVMSRANLYGADLRWADLRGANLYGADLYGADLRGANLYRANLYGEILEKTPIFITGMFWDIIITKKYLTIGCQRHSHEDWKNFKEVEISEMAGSALAFWALNKNWILEVCKSHREEE